jgi:hypothetical protein
MCSSEFIFIKPVVAIACLIYKLVLGRSGRWVLERVNNVQSSENMERISYGGTYIVFVHGT